MNRVPLPVISTRITLAWLAAMSAATALAQPAPPVEQDCARGQTPHEAYAAEMQQGARVTTRLHFCVGSPEDGLKQLGEARSSIATDTFLSPSMRVSLLQQLDTKMAQFRAQTRH